jgi:hypothetical protein
MNLLFNKWNFGVNTNFYIETLIISQFHYILDSTIGTGVPVGANFCFEYLEVNLYPLHACMHAAMQPFFVFSIDSIVTNGKKSILHNT